MTNKKPELIVGIFIFFGLIILGIIIFSFGNFEGFFKKSYNITVKFTTASGIIKGADVKLNGAKIGSVAQNPIYSESYNEGVIIQLKIFNEYKLPVNSKIFITQSNIFADKFIGISTPRNISDFLKNDAVVDGYNSDIMNELPEKLQDISQKTNITLKKLNASLESVGNISKRLDEIVLNKENSKKLSKTITNIDKGSEKFAQVISDFKSTLDNLNENLESMGTKVNSSKNKFDTILNNIDNFIKEIDSKIDAKDSLLGAMLSDKELYYNLKTFSKNLKEKGILRYKDLDKKKKNSRKKVKKSTKKTKFRR